MRGESNELSILWFVIPLSSQSIEQKSHSSKRLNSSGKLASKSIRLK